MQTPPPGAVPRRNGNPASCLPPHASTLPPRPSDRVSTAQMLPRERPPLRARAAQPAADGHETRWERGDLGRQRAGAPGVGPTAASASRAVRACGGSRDPTWPALLHRRHLTASLTRRRPQVWPHRSVEQGRQWTVVNVGGVPPRGGARLGRCGSHRPSFSRKARPRRDTHSASMYPVSGWCRGRRARLTWGLSSLRCGR